MKPRIRRNIQLDRDHTPTERVRTVAEQADAHLGGDEQDVVPTAPPTNADAAATGATSTPIETQDELTPG